MTCYNIATISFRQKVSLFGNVLQDNRRTMRIRLFVLYYIRGITMKQNQTIQQALVSFYKANRLPPAEVKLMILKMRKLLSQRDKPQK
jgi:hypothetical protein